MLINARTHLAIQRARQLTTTQVLVICLPVFLGLGLGFLVSQGDWIYALVLAALAPLAVLFVARPFIGIILWLLLMPFYTLFPDQELIYWAVHRILIPLTLCLFILPRLLRWSELPRFILRPPEVCIAILAVYVPISILLSHSDTRLPLIVYANNMLVPFLMYLIIRLSILNKWEQQLLQWTALFIALSQCTIGIISWIAPGLLPAFWLSYFQTRMCGSLINPNVFGVMLGFCSMILFQSAMTKAPGLIRTVFSVTCAFSMLCVFLTMERAVWLGAVAVIFGLFFLFPKQMLRYVTLCIVVFAILGAGFLSEKIAQANTRIKSQSQINIRIALFDAMSQMIQAKPVFGWGFGTLNQNLREYYNPYNYEIANDRFETSHNTYLTIFTELGLVGSLLYLHPLIWLFVASLQAWQGPPKMDPARRILLAILWLAALHNLIVNNFMDMRFHPVGIMLWWMNLGLIANLIDESPENGIKLSMDWAARGMPLAQPADGFPQEDHGIKN
jgi:O-antigen ligase